MAATESMGNAAHAGQGAAPARGGLDARLGGELQEMRAAGTYKALRSIAGPSGPMVQMQEDGGTREVLLLCSNNYLGLANDPEVVAASEAGLRRYGAGTASVRFICGTFALHGELEAALAGLLGSEAALTYVSCWSANEAVIPTLAGAGDAILSDALNHASIIDAVGLTREVQRLIYRHGDMDDLDAKLKGTAGARMRFIITDGVFSMEGDLAKLPEICDLADAHNAVVIVDDSHGTGVLGKTGRGTAEHFGLLGRIDVTTSTLGKALGGAAGGFAAASRTVIDYLIQRSRPQLFSNALPPAVAAGALKAVEILRREPERVQRLRDNAAYLRGALRAMGYQPLESESAIVPIIVGDTALALRLSQRLYNMGVYVIGFGYPVVPEGAARLRVQLSAAHTREHLDRALAAFAALKSELPANAA